MKNKEEKISQLLKVDESIPEDSAIFLRNLSFCYEKNRPVIRNLNLDIKKSKTVAFIGKNGSGKSTLAKLIDGILVQDAGDIAIFRRVMTDENALLLRGDIGLVFQNPDSQFIGATVEDDIAFGLENKCLSQEEMRKIVLECASLVGMENYLKAAPENLSGGQKQRVAIAGAIARKPKILILDEAGAMLDPKGKHAIRNIIKKEKELNPEMTILIITHEIEEAYDADEVIVLADGNILFSGTPQEVFTHEDKLTELGLDIPFAHQLRKRLKEKGLSFESFNDEKEFIQQLCQ